MIGGLVRRSLISAVTAISTTSSPNLRPLGQPPGTTPFRGDAARTDPARRPLTDQAAPAIPREQTQKMIQAAKDAGYVYLKTIMNATPGGPEIATQRFVV